MLARESEEDVQEVEYTEDMDPFTPAAPHRAASLQRHEEVIEETEQAPNHPIVSAAETQLDDDSEEES